jgi:hypothetical protein
MPSFQPHPEEAALLRLVDGELPPADAQALEEHVAGCPECRSEVEALRATAAECMVYRAQVLDTMLPPPPEPWPDLAPQFARIDRSLGSPAGVSLVQSTATAWWRMRPALRWALAAALVLAVVGVYEFRETPSVEAASLLQKAEIAAAKRPSTVQRRVLIRTRNLQMTRVVGARFRLPKEPAAPALQALFEKAHWDWNDPLSAQAFADWRNPLKSKVDWVDTTADAYQIRTTTPDGELAAASLTLRAADLEPIEARLEFRDQDWVELTEAAEAPEDGGSVAAPAPAPRSATGHAAPFGPPATVPSGETVSVSDVLPVLAELHKIGADLGEQVDVNPIGGKLVVTGVGIPAARQQQIQAQLEKFPNVTVQFAEPGAPPPVAAQPPNTAVAPPTDNSGGGIAAQVERQLGGKPQFERFSSQMLDWNDSAMARAYALRRLAERFPASVEASFSPEDRHILRQMARENAAALAGLAARMNRTLNPVLVALGGQTAAPSPPAADAWQPAAEDLLLTAKRVERRLSILLGAAPSDGAPFSPSDFLGDLSRLQYDIARCQRLLGQE